ncbi:hypothetical protein [Staphylococcus phage Sa2wa_st8]|uniref:Uncharacterized protein n=2 Tax=Triavirus P240 TaxID=2846265 RepID=A0A514U638_9CAUD|nr:hypothetical protein [Staphylococcus phage phiSa2wa_st93mssa]QDK04418.1 hypothetical protein [Staphylococcus phage Sa2wa_st8]
MTTSVYFDLIKLYILINVCHCYLLTQVAVFLFFIKVFFVVYECCDTCESRN